MANLQPGAVPAAGLRVPSNGKTIYHRPLNRSKAAELSQASFAYLFGEMVAYAQRRVKGIQELEQRCGASVTSLSPPADASPGSTCRATPSASSCSTCCCTASRHACSCGR